ncbi:class I SAM-dependent methyltransferase [Micromonospora sp. STR1_7]|uniref:Class I SAM-dependent methyltransferase n=1 Tax=Micromonospora parastrephiae TaxID=2806101 RepID=A0ABS1Y2Q0_9ACTN|nr:class I SAM-dependent methyltransferase [Micromonospora parastrephiae]MBM0235793.1 class I SAM-dependent methyltransferase [Micromonospora parastrephiae]
MTTAFDDHERSRWAGRAAAYDGSLAALCARPAPLLLDAANVGAGTRMLDAGTGPGTVAGLACARGATVVAVDAEPSMVEMARHRLPSAEEVRLAALPHLPFDAGHFDAAVANFVINHVGDPAAAIGELRRVVRPAGRIAVTTWPDPPPQAQRLWGEIFDAAGVERPSAVPGVDADKDHPRTPDGLTRLLDVAGLTDVRCDTITWVHRTDPEAWWSGPANGLSRPGLLMEAQSPDMITRIRVAYDELTAAYRDADGLLALPTAALLASASVPWSGRAHPASL